MSRDPKPLGKPYLASDTPYLKQYAYQTWNDAQGGGDYAEYSEFQKPYRYDEEEPEDYSFWENTWPDFPWPPPVTWPDLVFPECDAGEDCTFAKIVGPSSMKCGDCMTWSQMHLWVGCTLPPWWAAFGGWELSNNSDKVHLVFSGPVMATVCVDDDALDTAFTLTYNGPLGCSDSIEVSITDCESCCEDFTVTGDPTVNPGETWTGTISPACPDAECSVSSNSGCDIGCTVNGAGSTVSVDVGAGDCGTFTVTVTKAAVGDCAEKTASALVRINDTGQGGDWVRKEINYCGSGGCGCAGSYSIAPCIDDDTGMKFGTGAAADCSSNFTYGCSQVSYCQPSVQCECDAPTCFEGADQCAGRICPSPPTRYCSSMIWAWHRCEWECSC